MTNKNENTIYQNLWHVAKEVLRGKVISIIAYIKKRKISSKQHNFTFQGIRKRRTN